MFCLAFQRRGLQLAKSTGGKETALSTNAWKRRSVPQHPRMRNDGGGGEINTVTDDNQGWLLPCTRDPTPTAKDFAPREGRALEGRMQLSPAVLQHAPPVDRKVSHPRWQFLARWRGLFPRLHT